jgi:hypothetical protein
VKDKLVWQDPKFLLFGCTSSHFGYIQFVLPKTSPCSQVNYLAVESDIVARHVSSLLSDQQVSMVDDGMAYAISSFLLLRN